MQNFKAYEQRMDSGAVQVALEGAGAQIFIAPGSGFKLYSAIYENRQMLMPTDEPLQGSASNGRADPLPLPEPHARLQVHLRRPHLRGQEARASRAICTA